MSIQVDLYSTMHLLYLVMCYDYMLASCDVFQGVCTMCIFNMFLWNCNRIYVDKASNVVFSEYQIMSCDVS